MNEINNIKIVGFDEMRPPKVRKEPYIDLYFKLSDNPTEDWCQDFNQLMNKLNPPAKIDKRRNLFIETYVRDMHHIPDHLELIKKNVLTCNENFSERCRQRDLDLMSNNAAEEDGGEQGKLNAIIKILDFDVK